MFNRSLTNIKSSCTTSDAPIKIGARLFFVEVY
ncbi:uncharacterized protein UBRO2_06034 [Ustilago bromivora]|uniref:Uncharacterized protein n=1 Tax=Ustilago bromivora TaxID=307758 RepID=A0A8H8QUR5_9BASI|nr:uncharacterized protein UBRO2_06034 [Ustilago bromivora]